MGNPSPTRRLRYTGTLDQNAFDQACGNFDWYHSYYFDNGFEVRGQYDVGADIESYGFPENLSGLRVLDLGTGAGWFAQYFAQSGAEVHTVDARGYCDFDVYGRADYPSIETEKSVPDRVDELGQPIYFSPVSRGFWIMNDILGSKIKYHNARIYDMERGMFGGESFDLVFIGALLLHLRDPIGALMAARRVCRGMVIAATPVTDYDILSIPYQLLPWTALDRISWWLPNKACFAHWISAAGFKNVNVDREITYRCDIPKSDSTGRVVNADQTFRVGQASV